MIATRSAKRRGRGTHELHHKIRADDLRSDRDTNGERPQDRDHTRNRTPHHEKAGGALTPPAPETAAYSDAR